MSTTSSNSKLSLILMRDDGEARSIRISKKGLWLLIILTVMSPITGLIGLWVGWEAWRSISGWQQEKLAYQIQVDELRVQLERFATLEALLKRQDAALGGKDSASKQTNSRGDVGNKKGLLPVVETVKNEKNQMKEAGASTSSPVETALVSEKPASQPPKVALEEKSTLPQGDMSDVVNNGVVKVEKVQVKVLNDKRIQAQLGLFSTEKVPQVSGHVQLAIVTADGKKYDLSGSVTNFRITRFKSIVINSPLPVSKELVAKAQLLVEVISGGNLVYRQKYPFD